MPKTLVPNILGDRIEEGDYRDALPVNMYAVSRKIRGSDGYMINQPGISFFGNTTGVDRGGFYSSRLDQHFRVTGNDLITISDNGTATFIGNIPGSLQVQIDESFNNLAVLADNRLFYYNPTDGFREILDPNLGEPIDFCFIGGYFFFTDSQNLYHTTLADEETILPLDFATSEISPDPTVSVNRTKENQVIVMDRHTTSWFYISGTENFAFSPLQGKSVKAGAVATQAVVELEGQWFMIGGRKEEAISIHAVTGGGLQQIATREIDKILSTYTEEELQTASMEARMDDGYWFIHVNLPNETLMYNHTVAKQLGTGAAWSILKTSVTSTDGWLGINGIFDPRLGRWVYGDRFAPRVGILDDTVSTLYGERVECILYTPMITLDDASIDEIEIKTISGFTPNTAKVAVSLSYDGQAYGQEWFELYGDKNERAKRYIVRRMGYVRDYVNMKFRTVTDSRLAFGAVELTYG